jgi:hypothetical protein
MPTQALNILGAMCRETEAAIHLCGPLDHRTVSKAAVSPHQPNPDVLGQSAHRLAQELGGPVDTMTVPADWLRPIYEQIRAGVLAGGYVQIDETPIKYLEPGNGKTKQGYFWVCHSPGRNEGFYRWETSRAAACLTRILPADFSGKVQCDGYPAYPAFAATHKAKIELAGCWAHVRRKFYEALQESPRVAGWILRQIQNLYRIEETLRRQRAGPQLRLATRASQSRPIVKRMQRVLLRFTNRFLPQSLLGGAIDYTICQWSALEIFLKDGRVELDNNLVENAIRPTALGKKNWLFIENAEAGQRSAILYTVIESCRRHGIDPISYLRDVLSRLPKLTNRQIPEVTPAAWLKNHKPALRLAS